MMLLKNGLFSPYYGNITLTLNIPTDWSEQIEQPTLGLHYLSFNQSHLELFQVIYPLYMAGGGGGAKWALL